jgi:hypothetical protein
MKIKVVRLSEDELEMEEFTFVFDPITCIFHFRKYETHSRACEIAPWDKVEFWFYPDPHKESSIIEPEISDWAQMAAIEQVTSNFKFKI